MQSYTVTFTNNLNQEINKVVFMENNPEKLEMLIKDYANANGFYDLPYPINWSANTTVATGTLTKPVVQKEALKEVIIVENPSYLKKYKILCRNCGEGHGVEYITTYASGDYYKCNPCEVEFHA